MTIIVGVAEAVRVGVAVAVAVSLYSGCMKNKGRSDDGSGANSGDHDVRDWSKSKTRIEKGITQSRALLFRRSRRSWTLEPGTTALFFGGMLRIASRKCPGPNGWLRSLPDLHVPGKPDRALPARRPSSAQLCAIDTARRAPSISKAAGTKLGCKST